MKTITHQVPLLKETYRKIHTMSIFWEIYQVRNSLGNGIAKLHLE
jgi:hypothetical protein